MSQSVSGLNKAKVGGFQGAEGTQPPPGTGDLAGKKVTAGDVFKTIGRVALGLVTLGVSELVIRLVQRAQRQPPEVVPTKGPGKAAQTLAPAGAPPKGNDGPGDVPTGDTLARSTGPVGDGPGWRDRAPAARRGRGEPATEAEGRSAQGAGAADLRDVLGRGEERHASERQGRQDRIRDVPQAVRRGTGRPPRLHELRIPRLERSPPRRRRDEAAPSGPLRRARQRVEKLPPYEGPVHRGANLFRPEDQARYAPGQTVAEPCFTSSSRSTAKAFDGNTQWAMESKGGRDISFISRSPEEQEILFPRNARFEVLDSRQVGRETHVVMKEV